MRDAEREGWKPVEKVRAHEQVLSQIEEQLLSGRLGPGDRLPGERQLSELLGVSRSSVREALRVLEALEIVVARTGTGNGSGSTIAGEPSEALTNLLRLHIAVSNFSLDEVVETRSMIERWSAQISALSATPDDLEAMKGTLERMEEVHDPVEFNELDTLFHVQIAQAAGNLLVSQLMQSIRDAIRHQMVKKIESLDEEWSLTASRLRRQHRAILDAIVSGDVEGAGDAVVDHIVGFYGSGRAVSVRSASERQASEVT